MFKSGFLHGDLSGLQLLGCISTFISALFVAQFVV
jgi:hypothetical protein